MCLQKNKMIWKIITNFRRWILWRVTVILEKESWGIRISLNTMKSVRVFNEILLIVSRLFLKKKKKESITIMNTLWNLLNNVLGKERKLPTMDSLRVTIVPFGKSWGTISSIKHCRQLSKCLMLRIHKNSRSLSHKEKLKIKKWIKILKVINLKNQY